MSDYIKREDAIKEVKKYRGLPKRDMAMLADDIRAIPSADVIPRDYYNKVIEELCKMHQRAILDLENKRGEWISAGDGHDGRVRCSYCLKSYDFDSEAQWYDYCPNCGADMRGEQHE